MTTWAQHTSMLPEPEVLLNELGIDPELRAEQLPVEAFARLAQRIGRVP